MVGTTIPVDKKWKETETATFKVYVCCVKYLPPGTEDSNSQVRFCSSPRWPLVNLRLRFKMTLPPEHMEAWKALAQKPHHEQTIWFLNA